MNWEKCEADINMIFDKHFTAGRGGKDIEFIGIHYNAGDLKVEGCYSVWQSREASAHFQVESGGRIGQLVWDRDTAWALGDFDANQRSISIEHTNNPDGTITEACLDNGAHLVAALCRLYGLGRPEWLKNVYPHKHFSATSCPGQIYGSQKDAYIQRAQYWYDKMGGADVEKPNGGTSAPSAGKSVAEVAAEVIAGSWGNGDDRRNRLTAAGYDYDAVQAEVNRQLGAGGSAPSKSVATLAQEVLAGEWGNGSDRKARLESAGYDYGAVQAEVNRLCGVGSSGGKSVSQLAQEVMRGDWGNGSEREQRLTAAGYDYAAVQAEVNRLCG